MNSQLYSGIFSLALAMCMPLQAEARGDEIAADAKFDAPEMLYVGDDPLNTTADKMYPSPAIYDVDGDGVDELVVGDIFGTLNVYENSNTSAEGDPVWKPCVALKTADGEKIKVFNW